jgi:hypothetical protein
MVPRIVMVYHAARPGLETISPAYFTPIAAVPVVVVQGLWGARFGHDDRLAHEVAVGSGCWVWRLDVGRFVLGRFGPVIFVMRRGIWPHHRYHRIHRRLDLRDR